LTLNFPSFKVVWFWSSGGAWGW